MRALRLSTQHCYPATANRFFRLKKQLHCSTFVKLTENPAQVTDADINSLRENGWSDGEILEINQVSAYFAYANRTVLGLGINTDGEFLGLSPGDSVDAENWKHH